LRHTAKRNPGSRTLNSVYRNTTPTNNVVARATAWERLAMASFNDYELKLKKKKIIGNLRIHSTGLYLISQEELIKKKMKNLHTNIKQVVSCDDQKG